MTLLQTVPEGVNLVELEDELIRVARDQYQTDINVHNLHVWKLSGRESEISFLTPRCSFSPFG